MKQHKILHRIANNIFNRSKTWLDVSIGILHKLDFLGFRHCHQTEDPISNRERENEDMLKDKELLVKEVDSEDIEESTEADKSLDMSVRAEMSVAGDRVKMDKEDTMREREERMKACYDVLSRLKEIQVQESSDLDQFNDLNEILCCYSLMKDDFFVDLLNHFITEASEEIGRSRIGITPRNNTLHAHAQPEACTESISIVALTYPVRL